MTQTKTRITEQMARELMAEIVNEKGRDYRVDFCSYTHPDGTPNCIIGHLFHRLGVVVPEYLNATRLVKVTSTALIEADYCVIKALQKAQDVQDDLQWTVENVPHRTWGEAYDAFLAELEADRD